MSDLQRNVPLLSLCGTTPITIKLGIFSTTENVFFRETWYLSYFLFSADVR